ncbi:TMAO reductase system periplasmic protein TorT [Sulfitobacter sp. F26169L]|uniref:TMAO reductase system periplasmic protein TorT n=1 Tax=Sulfitobacter sp. F26169L TaxID=2996015 RepID=UPI002260963D|nr:TMAO reductase system periplasmic protein TorT [Sulfitobacter sp. F26169L]MCX7567880.1 TMAO reductase system periplasmic protein TorT [Sulfitobacter sp. F26169L]
MIAKTPIALSIRINLVSKLVRCITRQYGAALVGTIIPCVISVFAASLPADAQHRPEFCVLVPHFKDEYWLSVGYGIEQEAARKNVDLLIFEAGGYHARIAQIEQLKACAKMNVDAILIGAVTFDHPDLTSVVTEISMQVPVFGLVNALDVETLHGRVGVDWKEMGRGLGEHLALRHPVGSAPKTAVFLTGPREAGWTSPLQNGLVRGLSRSSVEIIGTFEADTGLRNQLELAENALSQHPNADYLIGSAPAVEAAFGLYGVHDGGNLPLLISTYVNHSILRGLKNGNVIAASFDDPVKQGIMALNQMMMFESNPGENVMIGPQIRILTGRDKTLSDALLSPADYFPEIR